MGERGDQLHGNRLSALGATLAWQLATPAQDRHALARSLLRELLGDETRFSSVCPECGGAHGPVQARLPRGPAPLVSITYAGTLVVVGAAPDLTEAFGIDAEIDSGDRRRAVSEAIGSAELCDWTRLEAVAKARRTGLRDEVRALDCTGDAHGWIAPPMPGFPELRGVDLTLTLPGEHGTALISVALAAATPSPDAPATFPPSSASAG